MAIHDKLTFTAEYCRARNIPYRIEHDALFIAGKQICFNLYNLIYQEILDVIDSEVVYDDLTQSFVYLKPEVWGV